MTPHRDNITNAEVPTLAQCAIPHGVEESLSHCDFGNRITKIPGDQLYERHLNWTETSPDISTTKANIRRMKRRTSLKPVM